MQSLRGIFPKPKGPPKRDFIKENVKNLKLMQQHNHTICQANDTNNYEGKINPQRKIRSNSHSRLRSTSSSVRNIATSKSMEVVSKLNYGESTRPLSVQSRDACSQTECIDDELFLKDVIIRLPSASICDKKTIQETAELDCPPNHSEDEEDQRQDHHERQEDNFEDISNKLKSIVRDAYTNEIDEPIHQFRSRCEQSLQLSTNNDRKPVIPTSYRKGEIPKYLKEMKLREDEQNRLVSLIDINCPPDHSVLSEGERLESLSIAQKKYQDLINELNHMSLTSKTLRIRNRQMEIEKQLRQLDTSIQIFSRSKVYVKNEDS